jgi:small multidrug resistance family-3 protein
VLAPTVNASIASLAFEKREDSAVTRSMAILLLFFAAALEASGDAILRAGLHSAALWRRALFFAVAAVVLFAYGWTVNRPPWDFGKLLGLYVVFFFIVAQLLSWLAFKQPPSFQVLWGGGLIIAGGVVIALAS